jgi:hypothetical protein
LCIAGEGDIRLNGREFLQHKWVGFPVPANLNWIEGVKRILDAIGPELLSKLPQRRAPDSERGPVTLPSLAVH